MAILTTISKDVSATLANPKFSAVFREKCATRTNFTPPGKCWRFVHDGKKVLVNPFASISRTGTRWTLFCADTKEECDDEIKRLSLTPLPVTERGAARKNRLLSGSEKQII